MDYETNSIGEIVRKNLENKKEPVYADIGYRKAEVIPIRPTEEWSKAVLNKEKRQANVSPLMQWWLDEQIRLRGK